MDITEKVYNIDLVINDIKLFPQTYKTILKNKCNDGTCQLLLRKKLNRRVKSGDICKTKIPGTRFGIAIFYQIPKKYFILVESSRVGSNVYCFFRYKRLSTYYINLKEYWQLNNCDWIKKKNKMVFEGNVLLFI